ncbi:MAG TPA: ornithine cyclodeaminase family protein [Terriglobales bacterium]|jgi:alanine dehydrogenase|nr:ornithine cyclodeaminase family protein [Terriglobales bacterium]
MSAGTLLLRQGEIASLLSMEDCIVAVEEAFRLYGEGKATPPGVLGIHVEGGGFHIKAGVLTLQQNYFAAKVNANFPENRKRFGLPTIQGAIVLCDAVNGRLLALMDSMEITARRTGAATAVAAKYLARGDSRAVTICGCGNQGRYQLRALAQVLPLKKAYVYDVRPEQARQFAAEVSSELGIEVAAVTGLGPAVRQSDVCVTCTTSCQPLLTADYVSPGTFIAAVGADNAEKQELHPALMARSKVVADLVEQCATIGDLHHAIAAGAMTKADVHAELGEVAASRKAGRTSDQEIVIFDSTGMALQDVAAAAVAYEKAVANGHGTRLDLAA